MHAMVPGSNGALQEGHSAGAAEVVLAGTVGEREAGGAAGPDVVAPGRGAESTGEEAAARAEAAAATGSRAGAAPTWSAFLQLGHSTCRPAALSGACIVCEQWGQRITNGIHAPFAGIPAPPLPALASRRLGS